MAKLQKQRIDALFEEIHLSEKVIEEEIEPQVREGIQRYTGTFVPVYGANWDIALNEVYPVVQHQMPSVFFRTPRAFLKPRNKTFITKKLNPVTLKKEEVQVESARSAKTQENILNYSVEQMKYKKENRKVTFDAHIAPYGVMWHGYKGDFGMTEEKSIHIKDDSVFVQRVSPLRFIWDPAVAISDIADARWVGRIIDIPLRDLLEDDRLNVDKRLIKGFRGFGDRVGRNSQDQWRLAHRSTGTDTRIVAPPKRDLLDFSSKSFQQSRDAMFVRLYEIYLRPTKKEKREGKKGYILLLTSEQPEPLRESDWTVKAEGWPAKILQFNEVPDTMLGLSDIDTYKSIADQKNVIINLQIRNAQETSKSWVAIGKQGLDDESDIQQIQQGANTILLFNTDNIKDRLTVASPGGAASNELYIIDQRIQRNLEDKSGVSDLRRGFLQSGEESALSVKMRSMGSAVRPAYRQDIMADFLRESFSYINQLNRQFVPYREAVRIIGSLDLEWSDEVTREDLQAEVDVEIDVVSMLPENPEEELRRLNETLVLMTQGLTVPEIRAKIAQEGKTLQLSPIIEQILMRQRIRNPEVFRNIEPDESEGFVSVRQIREAKENVNAALTGVSVPFPPREQDDHLAKLEVYTAIQALLEKAGQISDALNQLIQIHQALMASQQQKQAKEGNTVKLKKGRVQTPQPVGV